MPKVVAGNKRHLMYFDEEAPDKKLISDGDILIKELSKKQLCIQTSLNEQLVNTKQFTAVAEVVPVTNLTSGVSTLQQFNKISAECDDMEKMKYLGLSDDDINFYFDSKHGMNVLQHKHKNLSLSQICTKLNEIEKLIKTYEIPDEPNIKIADRHKSELGLSVKPNSIETKLLEFTLRNKMAKQTSNLPHPMDNLKDLKADFEKSLEKGLGVKDLKKIQKKARNLGHQIEKINGVAFDSNNSTHAIQKNAFTQNSKWDVREKDNPVITKITRKEYTCKPQILYTIRNGEIIKLDPEQNIKNSSKEAEKDNQLLENNVVGTRSKVLYLKNLSKKVCEEDINILFQDFKQSIISIKGLKGRLRCQAFVTFDSIEAAEQSLKFANGKIMKDKPVVIQFGKSND